MQPYEISPEIAVKMPECMCPYCLIERENPEPRNRNERRLHKKELGKIMKKWHYFHKAIWVPFDDEDCECEDDENEDEEDYK